MDFKEYQKKSRETVIYPNSGDNFIYPAIGLSSEVGEVCGKIKRVLREYEGAINEEMRQEISKELGDVLWYLAQLSTEFGLSLDDVAKENIEKLQFRKKRDKIKGTGDNR